MGFINTLSYDLPSGGRLELIQRGHNGTVLVVMTDKTGIIIPSMMIRLL